MNKCKGCGKDIEWIHTIGGKNMPVDTKLIEVTNETHGKLTLVMSNGNIIAKASIGRQGYIPHWATCSKAKSFKSNSKSR